MAVKTEIADYMLAALKERLPEAGIIKAGPLHDDPVKLRESITLRDMDPSKVESTWLDRRATTAPVDQMRFSMHKDEIGGDQAWLLRGTVELLLNFARDKSVRPSGWDEADQMKEEILIVLNTMQPQTFISVDGHWCVLNISVDRVDTKEQGGKGSWIWRYFIFWEANAYFNPWESYNT